MNRIAVRCSLVAVLAASLSLALFWSAMVPIFQAPDEPTHFQYAHALATAKHIFRARDGTPGDDPELDALQLAMNTGGIAWHPDQVAAPAYGTPQFFAAADATVAPLPDGYFDHPGHVLPNLVYTYPIGAYALIGAWIAVLQKFHAGIVEQVFGAREFCCFLFTIGLFFWYVTFRALPLSVPCSLGLTAIVGLFPLSSFVASYVQGDNVTFALVAPILYLSLRVRNGDLGVATIAAYGLLFALLLTTKFHYALCAAIATAPIVFIALNSRGLTRAQLLIRQALIFVPAGAAMGLYLYISSGARQGYLSGPGALSTGISGAFAQGLGVGLSYTIAMANAAYRDYFFLGGTMMSYWGRFGWANVDVTFHNAFLTNVVWSLIVAWTNVIILLMIVLIAKNLGRLRQIAVRRSWREAIGLLLRNPVINIYVAFTLLMLLIYIASGNTFAAQGRNWYPLEGSAFATMLAYAPRAFRRGVLRTALAGLGSVLIVGYVTVGSYYCISAVETRYYQPTEASASLQSFRPASDLRMRYGGAQAAAATESASVAVR